MTFANRKLIALVPIAALIALFVVLNITDPADTVASILLVFLLLYVICAATFFIILRQVHHLSQLRLLRRGHTVSRQVSHARSYYIACIVAFAPVCLLAMQSLHQVRVLDLLLVGALTALAVFYAVKRTQ